MKVAKIILLVIGAIIVLLIGVIVVAGLVIPAERGFANEVTINAPAETVWDVINDRQRYTEWQTNLDRVEVVDEAHWLEYPKDLPEPLRFSLLKDERPRSMEFGYAIGDSFGGKWKGEMTPSPGGVMLRTHDSYVAKGWLTKIMIFAFFDMNKFAKEWNEGLKARAESVAH